jgi:hypothetical protein
VAWITKADIYDNTVFNLGETEQINIEEYI